MADAYLDSPVFIGGAARSGTTLIRNLLEGHKNVLVLPKEPTVMQHYNRLPEAAREEFFRRDYLYAQEMLNLYDTGFRRFMASALTRSFGTDHEAGGEIDEALFRETYSRHIDEHGAGLDGVFAAVARAYCAASALPKDELRHFAVKRPIDVECGAFALKQAFPKAKFIHLLRDPRTRYVSVKSRLARPLRRIRSFDGSAFPFVQGIAVNSLVSFEMAKRNRQLLGEDYLVVRYEDLSADAPGEMARITAFLDIPYESGLVAPTQRGAAFDGNSSARENFSGGVRNVHADRLEKYRAITSEGERVLVSVMTREASEALGYAWNEPAAGGTRDLRKFVAPYRHERLCQYFANRRELLRWLPDVTRVTTRMKTVQDFIESWRKGEGWPYD